MGTRAITEIFDKETCLVTIYRQMDGYPDGHGGELAKLLSRRLVNGISGDTSEIANGMGCLAALVVGGLKGTEAGSIYLRGPITSPDDYESYNYKIVGDTFKPEAGLQITVTDYEKKQIFEGDLTAFAAWCEKGGDDEES